MPTLYQRVLGTRYTDLHPLLQTFHSQPEGAVADCRLEVIHPPGIAKTILRKLAGMPAEGLHEKTLLEVKANAKDEIWLRTIGGKKMVTRQWQHGDLLLEGVGPAVFGIELVSDSGGMKLETRRFWMLGVPIAKRIAPKVSAWVKPREKSWEVKVILEAPLLGTILIYEGEVTPR
jgi:hypothetical protein